MPTPLMTAAEAALGATTTSNMYININSQGTGTLTGDQVDAKLVKADRLLAFAEGMSRAVNSAAENNLFSAGEIDASWVYIEILRTNASIYCQDSFYQATNVGDIKVWRADVINGKLTVTEEIQYTSCIITKVETVAKAIEGEKLDILKVWFRFLSRQDTIFFFDQDGQAKGQGVCLIDFSKGTLKPAAAGGAE